MSLEIVSKSVAGETDKRLSVLNEAVGRTMAVGSNWTVLQATIRLSTNRASAWVGHPQFYFGLCSGKTAMPGSVTPAHFAGVRSSTTDWTWDNTNKAIGYALEDCRIKAGVLTASSSFTNPDMNSGTPIIMHSDYGHSVISLYITKSSSTTLRVQPFQSGSQTPASYNIDAAEFAVLANDIITNYDDAAYSMGYRGRLSSDPSFDETTNGILDTVCFAWLGSTDAFEISDIHCRKVS